MPSLRKNIDTENAAKATSTAVPERIAGGDFLRSAAVSAKRRKPIGRGKYVVAAPRMGGGAGVMVIAALATRPRKPNNLSRQVARLAPSHQINKRRQPNNGPKTATP